MVASRDCIAVRTVSTNNCTRAGLNVPSLDRSRPAKLADCNNFQQMTTPNDTMSMMVSQRATVARTCIAAHPVLQAIGSNYDARPCGSQSIRHLIESPVEVGGFARRRQVRLGSA